MFIHQDKETQEMTPYHTMADIARNTEITIGQLKHHFSVCKKTEWETDTFQITKTEEKPIKVTSKLTPNQFEKAKKITGKDDVGSLYGELIDDKYGFE